MDSLVADPYLDGDVWTPSGGIVGPYIAVQTYAGASQNAPNLSALVTIPAAQNNPPPNGGACVGDPVECSTGLLLESHTDFFVPDTIPIMLTRTYRTQDFTSRSFGNGQTSNYDMFIVGSETNSMLVLTGRSGGAVSAGKRESLVPNQYRFRDLHRIAVRLRWHL